MRTFKLKNYAQFLDICSSGLTVIIGKKPYTVVGTVQDYRPSGTYDLVIILKDANQKYSGFKYEQLIDKTITVLQ